MEPIRAYVLRVITCCFICAVAYKLVEKNPSHQRLVKMMAGMIILLTAVSPMTGIHGRLNFDGFEEYAAQAQGYVSDGVDEYRNELVDRIVRQSEAYVLEKAAQMDVQLKIEIQLSDDEIPVPISARIKGNVSPFVKSKLMDLIENDLGISKERQQWT